MPRELVRQELIDVIREHEDRYWTGYAIWAHLKQRFPQAAEDIARASRERASHGAGADFCAVSLITQNLTRATNLVDKQWVHTQGLTPDGRDAGRECVAVFRYRGGYDRTL